jgi:dihydrofolate synthase/folylpolyglutamate synthase
VDYKQTLDYLYARLPMFSRIGAAAIKNDLTNTIALCNFLDQPQKKFKTIHVAGTNGKGSVSHMLASILQTAGYKTGLYTSPHLKDFRERIKVNGEMVSQQFVIDFTERINPLIDEIEPSFFEITVAMAFEYFAEMNVDVAVIEVGLGGRLDSTNVITPEVSIITNIGWDHMNLLGDTLQKIAFEKAGIIKENVPVVIGETIPETIPVFENIAKEKNAPLTVASHTRQVMDWKWEKHELIIEVAEARQTDHKKYHLDLAGIYQTKNLLTVLEACSQLQKRGFVIHDESIRTGLQHAKKLTGLRGRWEVIHQSPLLVLDVAHNVDGIKQLLQQIEMTEHDQLHIILGVVKDKEISEMLALLPKEATYYFTRAQIPRALPEDELHNQASRYKLNGKAYSNVNTAIYAASLNAEKKDLIIICGSIFLAGEISAAAIQEMWGKEKMTIATAFFEMLSSIG